MTNFPKWSQVRADVVAAAGGEEAVTEARKRNQAYVDGHRLAERGTDTHAA
ncbi:hypothetical protein [Actinomadura sp. 6N118]|uniref:hypothetical protein n=1 Tax=Actinomadura sp. 6N118 TaxID=3375151 RepID=UPI0037BD5417